MSTHTRGEKYLTAKELSAELEKNGRSVSEDFARELIRATPGRLGLSARLSDSLRFWTENPDFAPFARNRSALLGGRRTNRDTLGIVTS